MLVVQQQLRDVEDYYDDPEDDAGTLDEFLVTSDGDGEGVDSYVAIVGHEDEEKDWHVTGDVWGELFDAAAEIAE